MVTCVTACRGLPCNPCALSVLRAYSERATFAQRLLTCGARDRVSVKVIPRTVIVLTLVIPHIGGGIAGCFRRVFSII